MDFEKEDAELLIEAGQALAYAICYSSQVEAMFPPINSFDEQLARITAKRGLDMTEMARKIDDYVDVLRKYGFPHKAKVLADCYNKLEIAAQELDVVVA